MTNGKGRVFMLFSYKKNPEKWHPDKITHTLHLPHTNRAVSRPKCIVLPLGLNVYYALPKFRDRGFMVESWPLYEIPLKFATKKTTKLISGLNRDNQLVLKKLCDKILLAITWHHPVFILDSTFKRKNNTS